MNYFLIDPYDGKAKHFINSPHKLNTSFIPGLDLVEAGEFTSTDLPYISRQPLSGKLIRTVPAGRLATNSFISKMRNSLEEAPILVNGYLIECDSISEGRMKNAIYAWESLPLVDGQFEIKDGIKVIYWTLADNTKVAFSIGAFSHLYNEMLIARSVREAKLHAAHQRIKNMTDVTVDYVSDSTNWF